MDSDGDATGAHLKGADVRTFPTGLTYKREELAVAGITVSAKDYERTVLRGIPEELAKFAAHLLSSARLVHKVESIDTDMLISHICEEADRMKNRHTQDQQNRGGGKKDSQMDEALAATSSEGEKKKRHKGKCHNCGKTGHWACKCHCQKKEEGMSGQASNSSSSGTASKRETKPVGSPNVVVADDSNGDGLWMVTEEVGQAQLGSAEPDPLLDEPEHWEETVCAQIEGAEMDLQWCGPADWLHNDWEDPLFEEEKAHAVITPVEQDGAPRVDLYDSGATRHISPYKPDFTSYTPLSHLSSSTPQTSSDSLLLGPGL